MPQKPPRQQTLDAPQPEERHLRSVVDLESGELTQGPCPGCQDRQTLVDELTRKYHGTLSQIGKLKKDRNAEARSSKWWPVATRLFEKWQKGTGHTDTEWSGERFWMIEKRLRDPSIGESGCERAIAGAIYDPFVSPKPRKNGTHKTHDDWDLIFDRSPDKTRDFIERAPLPAINGFMHTSVPPEERLPGHYIAAELADA